MIFIALTVNCKSTDNQSKMKIEEPILIAKGNLYGSGEEGIKAQKIVVENESQWQELMGKMNSVNKVTDSFTETKVDFSDYRIIAVFDALKNTGGHGIELVIQTNAKAIEIDVITKAPDGIATSVMTQPFYIAKIKRGELPIKFN